MTRYFKGDPYWLTLRYPGICRRCNCPLKKGDRAFRYKDGSLYCEDPACGGAASAEFEAAAYAEDLTSQQG